MQHITSLIDTKRTVKKDLEWLIYSHESGEQYTLTQYLRSLFGRAKNASHRGAVLTSWNEFGRRLISLLQIKELGGGPLATLAVLSLRVIEDDVKTTKLILKDRWFWPLDPINSEIIDRPNEFISRKLMELSNLRARQGERYPSIAYTKAANLIRLAPNPIRSGQQAIQLRGIGQSISSKIDEIMDTGTCSDLVEVQNVALVIDAFENIWGVGVATARAWYDKGYRSIRDLRDAVGAETLILTKQQRIGLSHYEDFMEVMPREVMTEIGERVSNCLPQQDFTLEIVGSYRRGKRSSKDVDMIVFPNDPNKTTEDIREQFLQSLVEMLGMETLSSGKRVIMGSLLHDGKWRRIDVFFVDRSEMACALIAHTGPASFNIELRRAAIDRGLILNEYHLKAGNKIIETPTEESVMRILGFEYLLPDERF